MYINFSTDSFPPSKSRSASPVLTRAVLERNGMADILRKDSPGKIMQSEVELTASLNETLRQRPAGDMWLFGYGSLIWNPAIRSVETRVAKIDGWHRSFCLSTNAGRGSPEVPGLVLALDEGGTCFGTAYRIAEEHVETELSLLWRREMLCAAYCPIWVEIKDQSGQAFGWSLAFVINTESPHYAADLGEEAVVETLATASGGLGTAADYLYRTRDGLRSFGISDSAMERLAEAVEQKQMQRMRGVVAIPTAGPRVHAFA